MLQPIRRQAFRGAGAVLAALCLPLAVQAGKINIILSDMDVTYLNSQAGGTGALYDSMDYDTANLDPVVALTDSDTVESAVFELDDVIQGTLMTTPQFKLFADFRIDGIGANIPFGFHTGLGSNGDAFGFDWFTSSGGGGDYLRLTMTSVDLLLSNGVLFFTGTANVADQNLPFGLAFNANEPVTFSYTATLPGINGSPAAGVVASGAMTISQDAPPPVPEPSTIVALCVCAIVAGFGFTLRR